MFLFLDQMHKSFFWEALFTYYQGLTVHLEHREKIEQSILQKSPPSFFSFEDSCEEKHFYSSKLRETCDMCTCNITSRTSYFYFEQAHLTISKPSLLINSTQPNNQYF